MTATLNGIVPELKTRVQGMLVDGKGNMYVSSAFRTAAEQEHLYQLFLEGKGQPANRPGTSKHETGEAVDIECAFHYAAEREDLAKKWGLAMPHSREPWHMELDPNRQPLPKGLEEKMIAYADKVEWEDGSRTQAYSDGAVRCYGSPFHGAMGDLKDELKKSFSINNPIVSIRRQPGQGPEMGYILGCLNGDEYSFPLSEDQKSK